jgi:hypothetical protein
MKALIEDLRLMTGAGAESIEAAGIKRFSDEELERKLQNRAAERLVQAPVQLISSIELTGEGTKLVLKNGKVNFEGTLDTETATLVSFWGAALEGATTIYGDGRIEFEKSQLAKTPLLTGTTYDLNGAAADVLTDWASAAKLGYDITADGQTLTRSQRHEQLLTQAEEFRKRAIVGTVSMSRSDLRPGGRNRPFARAVEESFDQWGLYPQSTPEK